MDGEKPPHSSRQARRATLSVLISRDYLETNEFHDVTIQTQFT